MRCSLSDDNGQCDNAGLFVVFRVACIIAMQYSFGVQCQRNGKVDGGPFETASLGHECE